MKSKEIFSVAVRIIGLAFLYNGLAAVPSAWSFFCPIFPHFNFHALLPSLFAVAWPLAVAWWLVRGAPLLIRLAYPKSEEPGGQQH